MTKSRQPDDFNPKQYSSLLLKNWPAEGTRDDSPVSVIAHSAVVSHSSSTCTSMEHQNYQEGKLHQLYHLDSTSEEDTNYNNSILPNEFLKVRGLESLPETHPFPLKQLGCSLDDPYSNVQLLMKPTSENGERTSNTASASSAPDTDEEFPHFSISCEEGHEASMNFFSPRDVTGRMRGNIMVIRPDSWKEAGHRGFVQKKENGAQFVGYSPKSQYPGVLRKQKTLEGSVRESQGHTKPNCATERGNWEQRKHTNTSVSIESFVENVKEKDSYGSQELATAELGAAPMGGCFPIIQNLSGSKISPRACPNAWHVSDDSALKNVHEAPNYLGDPIGRSNHPKTLPSKWEDAEKWLVNAAARSPSHPLVRNGLSTTLPNKSLLNGLPSPKKSINATLHAYPAAKPSDCSFSGGEILEENRNQSHAAAASDSDLPKASEFIALTRSGSEKYTKQQIHRAEKLGRMEARRVEFMQNLRCSGGRRNHGRKEAPKTIFCDRKITEMEHQRESTESDRKITEMELQRESTESGHNVQNVQVEAKGRSSLVHTGTQTEILTQDEFANTMGTHGKITTLLTEKREFVCGLSASMKDASTEISPAVSRRDMGTQVTPLASCLTSPSVSPARNNSPPRHNTPTQRSISWNDTGLNLGLELENYHLAKLELRDVSMSGELQSSYGRNISNWNTPEEEEEISRCSLRQPGGPDIKFNILEARASAWEAAERAKCIAKYKREEARMDAWDDWQRAKAEAELKKLEIKLEKLRCRATEKIMNKRTAARRRAQDMRAAAEAVQIEQLAKIAERATNIRKNGHFPGSFAVCFARFSATPPI